MHSACPIRNKIIYKTACSDELGMENLLKTGFAQKEIPSCPSSRHKPQSFIESKTLRFCNPDTKKLQKMNQTRFQNRTASVLFLETHVQSKKKKRKALSRFHFGTVWRNQMRPQNRKIHSKGNKQIQLVFISNQHLELRRPAHARPDFN